MGGVAGAPGWILRAVRSSLRTICSILAGRHEWRIARAVNRFLARRTGAAFPAEGASSRRAAPVLAICLACLSPPAAWASDPGAVTLRTGDHPGFGRVVFDFPDQVPYSASRTGNRLVLRFQGGGPLPEPERLPRNVARITVDEDVAELLLRPNARVRHSQIGTRVVIDILDPPPPAPAPAPNKPDTAASGKPVPAGEPNPGRAQADIPPASDDPGAAHMAPLRPVLSGPFEINCILSPSFPTLPGPPASEIGKGVQDHAPAITDAEAAVASRVGQGPILPVAAGADRPPQPSPQGDQPASAQPMSLLARHIRLPPADSPGAPDAAEASAIVFPFSRETGAGAFRRGAEAFLVFDERRPLDLSELRDDPLLGSGRVELLPEATVVRFPAGPNARLRLLRTREGWAVTGSPGQGSSRPIPLTHESDQVRMPVGNPGKVIAVPDPLTGGNLLVGTLRPSREGQEGNSLVEAQRRAPGFALLETWFGVAVEPISDRVVLRATPDGFVLSGMEGGTVAPGEPAIVDTSVQAAHLTRLLDLPDLPRGELLRRLQAQIIAAASQPPRTRGSARLAAAQAMVALGLGAEAQALLRFAADEDAQLAEEPRYLALAAISALVAGRLAEAGGIDDPRLGASDEMSLWRALRKAETEEDRAGAAHVLAATVPLLLSYPAPLRDRFLPLAAETMILSGETAAGEKLLASRPADPALSYARALLLSAKGDVDGALSALDALKASKDRLLRARALQQATELRLASGRIGEAEAAKALARQLMAWRGDEREFRLRLRLADLYAHAGEWRQALSLLRETESGWPEHRSDLRERMRHVLSDLLCCGHTDTVPPLDFVALAEENADLVTGDQEGALANLVADKLVALDLPQRAALLLDRMVEGATGTRRAELGIRLATVHLDNNDPAGALSALLKSEAAELPADVSGARNLVKAKALARSGELQKALSLLSSSSSEEADNLRAEIAEQARNWHEALSALTSLAKRRIPADGPLSEDQKSLLVRLAEAAAQDGNAEELQKLRERETKRMEGDKLGQIFRLLTAPSIRDIKDIPRSAEEIALARSLSQYKTP